MKLRKGQAALEFLTTYGWAFLVILVMIGALAYFGVLSPEKFVSERCHSGIEYVCDKEAVTLIDAGADHDLTIQITNKAQQTITPVLDSLVITSDDMVCTGLTNPAAAVPKNGAFNLVATGCTAVGGAQFTPGDKINADFSFDYEAVAGFVKTQNGNIVITAQ